MFRAWRRRKRRGGLTTVEYALMLFFFVMTAIFGFPKLVLSTMRYASTAGDAVETVADPGGGCVQ